MPRANIWITEDNWKAWQDIPNKSEFINELLRARPGVQVEEAKQGSYRAALTAKTLERACCVLKKPCQHWQWNGDKQLYVNALSGRERAVE